MLKKILFVFTAVLMSAGMFALTPRTGDVWDADTHTLTIHGDPGTDGYNIAKEEIEHLVVGIEVDTISNYAFATCTNLHSISFVPGSPLKTIGESAFSGTAVTSLQFPDAFTTLRTTAFAYCAHLTSVVFPAGTTTIGYSAFENCDALVTVTIYADALTEYGEYAFHDCNILAYIYVPNESVATYKAGWAAYEEKIKALSDKPTGIDQTAADTHAAKFIREGQLFIRRDGRTFTLTGQAVDIAE